MRVVLSVLLWGLLLVGGASAFAQAGHEPPPGPALSPEQEAHRTARRERLRTLRQEMLREMREGQRAQPVVPERRLPRPPGEGGMRAGWSDGRERAEPAAGEYPYPPPPPPPAWRPGPGREGPEGATREPPPNRLSAEERRQLRRQMREAAREVYGE